MPKYHVTTRINGDEIEFLCFPEQTLLDILRDSLGLTGSKEGCSPGDCGACSIILDNRLVCACLILAVEVNGKVIDTIEGMADGDTLHPMQAAFKEEHGLQCGFCTPGMVMIGLDIAKRHGGEPSEAVIRNDLEGNLCRCTGYHNIVKAIAAGAKSMSG